MIQLLPFLALNCNKLTLDSLRIEETKLMKLKKTDSAFFCQSLIVIIKVEIRRFKYTIFDYNYPNNSYIKLRYEDCK